MALAINLICDIRTRKDGTNPLYIQYCRKSDERTLLHTDVDIPARCWNSRLSRISKELPSAFGDARALNDELAFQIRMVEDIIRFAKKISIENEIGFLKATFHSKFALPIWT